MDDTTVQNPVQPIASVDPTVAPQPVPAADPVVPMPPVVPVDPMDNVQVPDLPTAPVADPAQVAPVPVQPEPVADSLQQMAAVQQVPQSVPAPMPEPTVQVPDMPAAQVIPTDPSSISAGGSSLGPVTMEDLMEELQHIEDKLDEMDEKL